MPCAIKMKLGVRSLPLAKLQLQVPMSPPPAHLSQRVAVVGAGAAGLVAAKELRQEGHMVVVFESGTQLGGTWVYTPQVESDPLGKDPSRKIIHSSLYGSLRTNLPREVMGFRDFPFVTKEGPGRDSRRFPGHQEVLRYLEDFACEFELNQHIRYKTAVQYVGFVDGKWKVRSKREDGSKDNHQDETFDAVVVCNGHHTEPRIAEIPGIEQWPGRQVHSHNYRDPQPYKDLVVVLIGSSASADDISRDIAGIGKEVHIAARSASEDTWGKLSGRDNVWLHPMIKSASEDGTVTFEDGNVVLVDVILHCTGYKYHFPFLQTNGVVVVDDNRVGPLYQHVFPPDLAPSLSFVGIPWRVVPFPHLELQSKWIACILSGRVALPPKDQMHDNILSFYNQMESEGVPKRYTHYLGQNQFEYNDWLACEVGCSPSEDWRKQMYFFASKNKRIRPETYRDEWDDEHLISEARKDFAQYVTVCSLSGIEENR